MKIIFAAGGTAGHINPAIAVADYMNTSRNDCKITFIGTQEGMEKTLIPKAGYEIKYIDISGFDHGLLQNMANVIHTATATLQARKILKQFKPNLVIGTGGYVSGPVIVAAHFMGIPTIIHEQNVIPGKTIKLLSRIADKTAISFKDTAQYLPRKDNIILTGNPIRQALLNIDYAQARRQLHLDARPMVLICSGSLGAERINHTLLQLLNSPKESYYQIVASTGQRNYQHFMEQLGDIPLGHAVYPYIDDMPLVMNACDLCVCRAGALTISELNAIGKPHILIPSPNVAHDHQTYNARFQQANGAALFIPEKDLSPERLSKEIENLLKNRPLLSTMSQNAKKLAITDAHQTIAQGTVNSGQ